MCFLTRLCSAGEDSATVKMIVKTGDFKLWWPAGMGPQSMYNVTATFTPHAATAASDLMVRSAVQDT